MSDIKRRQFLGAAGAGALASLGDFGFLNKLPILAAQEVPRRIAPVSADLEPLVRLIEDTPRERLLEEIVGRIHHGTSYQELLGAVLLAGVRGIQPRPVGFKFHAVLVINSAHLASMAAEDRDRWLPLLWAIDNYKVSQARNRMEGDWVMPPPREDQIPAAGVAAERFQHAMDHWEEEGADRAASALARTASANEVYEMLWRYGARDFRDIGHKAIYVANSYRALQTIGWRHAEPILRSLTYALLEHEGENPATRDDFRDRPMRDNMLRARAFRADWREGRIDREATADLLAAFRTINANEAGERVSTLIHDGISPTSIWDACFLMAGELVMRQPGIGTLHSVTAMNALHFGYQTSGNDETRRLLLLQAASFLPLYRPANAPALRIDQLEPLATTAQAQGAIEEIFADVSRDRRSAARKALAVLAADPHSASAVTAHARRLVFSKGTDAHDYKFSGAILEDFHHATPAWRDRLVAASMFYLKGSGDRDTDLSQRARAALAS